MSKNVILYARVSTQKQSSQGESLNVQIDEMRRFAQRKEWNILSEFQEQFTGTKDSRPELNNAIERIKMYKRQGITVDFLLVTKIDRNTRGGSEVHFSIKTRLKDLGVELRDVQGIIQEERNIVDIQGVNTTGYDWAMMNPSETSEVFMSMSAQQERKAILQRTISQEIRNSYEGYWVKPPTFGYKTKAIISDNGSRKTIQESDPIEAKWIIRIFEMKSAGYSDDEIVQEINEMGYLSRVYNMWNSAKTQVVGAKGGKKLEIKQLQSYIKNPIYAGVSIVNWRGNDTKLVRQKYKGLVTIDLWNKANKGKRKLILSGNEVTMTSGDDSSEFPEIKRRNRLNPNFPFGKLVLADGSNRFLNHSSPRSRSGKRYNYYTAKGSENYPIEEFEKSIISFFHSVQLEPDSVTLLNKVLEATFNLRKEQFVTSLDSKRDHLNTLEARERSIINNIGKISEFEELLSASNKELKLLKEEKQQLKDALSSTDKEIDVEAIKNFGKLVTENLGYLASGVRKHEVLKFLFTFTLDYTPSYSEIISRTTRLRPFFALNTKKRTIDDSFNGCNGVTLLGWQPHLESNQDKRLWRPLH